MSQTILPEPPPQLKVLQAYLRVASDVEKIDPVVAYWVRFFCTEHGMKIDAKSTECKKFLVVMMDWLEKFKAENIGKDTVSNETVGQAHMENFIVSIFDKADTLDREGTANKTTVRMFYMSALLFEAMEAFGPLTDEVSQKAKYAKFKAAYIQRCLKTGQTPKPGPLDGPDLQPDDTAANQADPKSVSHEELPKTEPTKSSDGVIDIPEVPTSDPDGPPSEEPYIMKPSRTPMPFPTNPLRPIIHTQPASVPAQYPPASVGETVVNPFTNPTPFSTISSTKFHATNGAPLNPEDLVQSQKYCKFANSALQYDDISTAVNLLEKALKLLKMGERSD